MREETDNGFDQKGKIGRVSKRPYAIYLLSILVRAFHQIGASVFLAVYLLNLMPGLPQKYLLLAILSGGILIVLEWVCHPQLFREVSGTVTLGKCFLLGAAFHGILPPSGTVLLAFFAAALVAHAPKKIRHRLLY